MKELEAVFSLDDGFDIAALIVTIAAAISFINYRFVRLPHVIGLTVIGLLLVMITLIVDAAVPGYGIARHFQTFMDNVGFDQLLMKGMLSLLLFAGGIQMNTDELHAGRRAVLTLAIVSTSLSTLMIGYPLYLIAAFTGTHLSLAWCLLFGALISPTDAVAVISALKTARVPAAVETRIAGESLFNDGVGVVLFTIASVAAIEHQDVSIGHGFVLFLYEGIGGGVFGYAIGWLAYRSLKVVDDPPIETLITLALAMGGYAMAERLGLSGIVAMAVAGVVIARFGKPLAMTEKSREYILHFWQGIEEILNSVLFTLIGLEGVILLSGTNDYWLALLTIPLCLCARLVSVAIPMSISAFARRIRLDGRGLAVLGWGGMRGGIPIALSLSLPSGANAQILQTLTYFVVVFSVAIQGGTLPRLARRLYPLEPESIRSESRPGDLQAP